MIVTLDYYQRSCDDITCQPCHQCIGQFETNYHQMTRLSHLCFWCKDQEKSSCDIKSFKIVNIWRKEICSLAVSLLDQLPQWNEKKTKFHSSDQIFPAQTWVSFPCSQHDTEWYLKIYEMVWLLRSDNFQWCSKSRANW